jgi:hypothetical protein
MNSTTIRRTRQLETATILERLEFLRYRGAFMTGTHFIGAKIWSNAGRINV